MCFINSFILQYLSDIYYIIGTILGAGVITLNNTKFLLSHAQFLVDRQETKKISNKWYIIKKINQADVIKSN